MLCHRSILCCVAHLMEANSNEMLLVSVCVLTAGAMHAAPFLARCIPIVCFHSCLESTLAHQWGFYFSEQINTFS
jgi:hypothetical protein